MAEQNLDNVEETAQDELSKKNKAQSNVVEQKAKDEIKGAAKKEAKKLARKGLNKLKDSMFESLGGAGASAFAIVAGIIIAILMLIGIVSFIVSMPGTVQDAIFNFVHDSIQGFVAFMTGKNDENTIKLSEINNATVEALVYLEEMGYDAVGYGFVAAVNRENGTTGKITSFRDNLLYEGFYDSTGIKTDIDVPQCLMAKYILANEETYLPNKYYVKNDADVAKVFASYSEAQEGMLWIDSNGGDIFDDLQVDRQNRVLTGESLNMIWGQGLYKQSFSYDLESWIGRYGKSLEFLIALQIATMSSGIGEELIDNESLETKVVIKAEQSDYDLDFKIESKNTDGTYTEIPITFGDDPDAIINKISISVEYDETQDTYVYDYTADESFGKDDVTISSLYKLVTQGEVSYRHGTEETYESIDLKQAEAIGVFLSEDEADMEKDIYIQYSLHTNSDTTYSEEALPYMGMYDSNSGEYFGLINESGQYICGTKQIDTTVTDSNQFTKIKNLNYYESTTLTDILQKYVSYCNGDTSEDNLKAKKIIDGITLFMNEADIYFINKDVFQLAKDKGVRIDECHMYESHEVKCGNGESSIVVAVPDAGAEYVIDVSPYEAYLYDYNICVTYSVPTTVTGFLLPGIGWDFSSSLEQTCFFVKWLQILEYAKSGQYDVALQHVDLLKEGMSKAYEIVLNEDDNIQDLVNSIWEDHVSTEIEPLSVDAIKGMYEAYESQNVGQAQMYYPTIKYVINHWYKDLDFSESYNEDSTQPIYAEFFEDDTARLTAILTGKHAVQNRQPYVIKGEEVTLDGEIVDHTVDLTYSSMTDVEFTMQQQGMEFGKGYEASKKIFTQGNYYTYDGTETTATGVYYNQVIEQLTPGTLCMVVVNERGNVMYLKLAKVNGTEYSEDEKTSLASTSSGSLVWADGLQEIQLDSSLDGYCRIAFYKQIEAEVEIEDENSEGGKRIEKNIRNWYCIYVEDSLQYISPAAEDTTYEESKASADRINLALTAMGVTNLRTPVSFDNTTSEGNTASLAAFSILEGSKTESGQAIYRDLKEFLIELGYYTKAEFDYLETNVLTWFIPDYIPENAEHWQRQQTEDVLEYGAVLLPASGEENETENFENTQNTGSEFTGDAVEGTTEGTTDATTEENSENTQSGFAEGLNVVAPGNCRILDYTEDSITLEFDGKSQPEIGMLNNYTMFIKGIVTADTVMAMESGTTDEVEFSMEDVKYEEGSTEYIVKMSTVIGYTGTEKIQIVFKNANGAYINNIEDYMAPKLTVMASYGETVELTCEILAPFEGESDADPNDGDYYTVEQPSTDIDTIGRGITGWTADIWKELGYGEYIVANTRDVAGIDDPPETIKQVPIPKSVVEAVKKEVVRRTLEETLDPQLESYGVQWTNYQKAAWISLHYNGFGSRAKGERPIDLIEHYANGDMDKIKEVWLNCYNSGIYEEGHKKRRATEYKMFVSGQWENSEEWMLTCKEEYYGYR